LNYTINNKKKGRKVKKKYVLLSSSIFFLGILAFILGYYYGRKEFVIYYQNQDLEVYPCSWPTYNLPLTEYSSLLIAKKCGLPKIMERRFKIFLIDAIYNAKSRLKVATHKQKKAIEHDLKIAEKVLSLLSSFPNSNRVDRKLIKKVGQQ
jgi:hypothetical protein